ncbi:MAG: SPOR domain-containing protein, partial [Steroidobacteraceae bacterium]
VAAPAAAAPRASAAAPTMHPPVAAAASNAHRPSHATSSRHPRRVAAAGSAHARASGHASGAGRVVQLGAFRTRARAQSEWKLLSSRFGVLRSLTPRYVAGRSRGARVYRLRVRMSSPAAASGLCSTLKRHAQPCLRLTA